MSRLECFPLSDTYFQVRRHTFAIDDVIPQEENMTADSQKGQKKTIFA